MLRLQRELADAKASAKTAVAATTNQKTRKAVAAAARVGTAAAGAEAAATGAGSAAGRDGVTLDGFNCRFCEKAGHKLEQFPTVKYEPGTKGITDTWCKCHSCNAIATRSRPVRHHRQLRI